MAAGSHPHPDSCLLISNRAVNEYREAQINCKIHIDLQWYKNFKVIFILDSFLGVWLTLRSLSNMDDRLSKKSLCF